jgi:HK97 family phage prohead protease
MRDGLEFRFATELRIIAGRRLGGYAAVFGVSADIGGRFKETIRPGAFRATLAAGADVVLLVDHDPARLLARTASGTLRLSEDPKGLAFEADVPRTQLGNDMLALAERRDLGGMSIGFRVAAGGDAWPSPDTRELRAVQLAEISIAQAWPAYPDTTIALRSRGELVGAPIDPAARRRLLDLL